jgi:hypothetical protein
LNLGLPRGGRRDASLHQKKGKRSSTASFSVVFIRELHLVSNVGILPVSLIAFKAFIMACIALSASFLKKVSISEKKFVFLHRGIAVSFFVLHHKVTKN